MFQNGLLHGRAGRSHHTRADGGGLAVRAVQGRQRQARARCRQGQVCRTNDDNRPTLNRPPLTRERILI